MTMPREPVRVPLLRLTELDVPAPAYQSVSAAGLDLAAAVPEPVVLQPGERRLVPTGYAIALPEGFEAQVRPRSGLALKHGVTVLNAPGTIDADYRGEIQVLLVNHGQAPFTIRPADRVAQLVVAPVVKAVLVPVAALDETARGSGGYGSTGIGCREGGGSSAAPSSPAGT
jgi:dUTP pyrophosphatase